MAEEVKLKYCSIFIQIASINAKEKTLLDTYPNQETNKVKNSRKNWFLWTVLAFFLPNLRNSNCVKILD